jgi:hypothetical protein
MERDSTPIVYFPWKMKYSGNVGTTVNTETVRRSVGPIGAQKLSGAQAREPSLSIRSRATEWVDS